MFGFVQPEKNTIHVKTIKTIQIILWKLIFSEKYVENMIITEFGESVELWCTALFQIEMSEELKPYLMEQLVLHKQKN